MSTIDSLNFFQSHLDIVRSVRTHCFASLAFHAWDTILTFADEVDYIWPIPWNYKIKWWYLYFRYATLAIHVAYSLVICHLTSGDASELTCGAWFLFAMGVAMFSKMLIELMVVIRAYALFNRRRWVLFLLCTLCAVDPTINLINLVRSIEVMGFGESCIFVPLSKKDLPYASIPLFTQTILVGIMLMRLFVSVRTGWRRTPLVSILVHEGFAIYLVLMATVGLSMAICLREGAQVISLALWATAIMSTCGCRFTINMQRQAKKHNLGGQPDSDPDPIFTTQISIEMTEL